MKTSTLLLYGGVAAAVYYLINQSASASSLTEPAPNIAAAVAAAPALNLTGLAAMPRRQRYSRFFTA